MENLANSEIVENTDESILTRGLKRYKRVITAANWKPIHDKILDLKVKGTSHSKIAELVDLSEQSIRNVIRSPYFEKRLIDARTARYTENAAINKSAVEEAKSVLNLNIVPAVHKMVEIMCNGESKDRIQLDAAQAILDRAGLAKSTIVENISRNYSPEEIESAKRTILEVESITARVTTAHNKFVIAQPVEPVHESTAKEPDAVGEILPASSDRPEALPA